MNSAAHATVYGNGRLHVGNSYNTEIHNYNEPSGSRCLADLRLSDPRDDKTRIEQTKGGLLKDSYNRLLWIKGDPGKGKTMLLIGIVDELERQLRPSEQSATDTNADDAVLSYFFCQGTGSSLNNATAVLRGRVFLLAVQQPSLASHLREKYEHSGSKLFEDANAFFALSEILSGMLRDPSLARAYIVINALDECETGLQQLLKLVVENTSASRVKWIVSSRKATGTFLWVTLVIKEPEHVKSWYVLQVVKEVPTGLEELYARIMKQIQQLERGDPVYCRLVLSAATLSYRPLHGLELGVLTGLPEEILSKAESFRGLLSMCGSFLTVRDDRVFIIHQSAKDYLSDKVTTIIFPPGRAEAHHGIFLQSLHSMRKSLRRDIYGLSHAGFSIDDLEILGLDPLASCADSLRVF
ncbi:hypothetical protein ACJ41O_010492 [Fusarium nematophilum]